MSYAFVQSSTGVSVAGTLETATTTSANLTGADTLFLLVGQNNNSETAVIEDSVGGNTWDLIRREGYPAGSDVSLFRCASASVSSSMTVTATSTTDAAFGLVLLAFSGGHASPDDQNSGHAVDFTDEITAGYPSGILPVQNDCVLIAGMNVGAGQSIDLGFTIIEAGNVFQESWGVVGAYLIQTTAEELNPTFSYGFNFNAAALLASFKPAAGVTPRRLLLATPA